MSTSIVCNLGSSANCGILGVTFQQENEYTVYSGFLYAGGTACGGPHKIKEFYYMGSQELEKH